MFIVSSYTLAVGLCFITMLCWGSWGNTQKLAAKTWRYELFYWDYVIGIVLFSLVMALTLGSIGDQGRSFIPDLMQISAGNFGSAFLGGIIFNGIAYGKLTRGKDKSIAKKGLYIALSAGFLMSFFYRFVAAAVDLNNFESPTPGMATPYTAVFIFSLGMLFSNFFFNTYLMRKPFVGAPVTYKAYFSGGFSTHAVGILGGIIWGLGTSLSYIATGEAGAAISYALGQGATMVAAFWGVFIWKEFKGASKSVNLLLFLMFLLFTSGLALIIVAGNQ